MPWRQIPWRWWCGISAPYSASAWQTPAGSCWARNLGIISWKRRKRTPKKIVRLTVITGLIGGVIVLLSMPLVLGFADLTETGKHYLKVMLLINSYYVLGAAVNTTLIAGVFRAGGDSRFGLICDVIDMWVYAVPLGFLAAFVFKLPVLWVYFLLCTDEFAKWPWVLKHYRSMKWLNNITRDDLFEEG